ncbi:hypothetical protein [Serratia sp. 22264]|uniref:hypothetical protein n=1 Tax=Serratia sp. 22264 TaxID=3453897 RepID=UPI003F83D420
MNYRNKLFSVVCILTALTSLPSQAGQKQFQCSGSFGDTQDTGLWDWVFIANNATDAAKQAEQKFLRKTSGAWVKVFYCK